jgi:hypothetical protein
MMEPLQQPWGMDEGGAERVVALEAENAALRRTLSDVGRIMAAPKREGWNASTKLVYVALQLQALAAPQDGAYSLLELSGSALAGSLGLSAATANNAMNRLAAAGLLERYLNRGLYDEAGREVDPRACHPGRADLHFESHSWQAMRAVPEALPALPTSAYSERARARAAGQRADYADLKARLTRLACPHCGAVGEWHLTCAACQQSPEPPSPPDEEPPPNQAPTPDDPPQPQPIEVQPPPEEALRGGDELQPLVIQGAEVQMPRPAPWTSAEVWQWLLRRIGASRAIGLRHIIEDTCGKSPSVTQFIENITARHTYEICFVCDLREVTPSNACDLPACGWVTEGSFPNKTSVMWRSPPGHDSPAERTEAQV